MQFFFTRTEKVRKSPEGVVGYVDGESITEDIKYFKDSFNIDLVSFTTEQEDGTRIVILNNGHSESRYDNYPVIKGGKPVGSEFRKEAAWYESQLTLSKEDNERFVKYCTSIYNQNN